MKKTIILISFVLIILALAFCLIHFDAHTFQVERTYKAQADGKAITAGQTIDENTTIKIDDDGFLLFVDNENKKRYYINTSCHLTVKKLIGKAKAPMQVTMSYLESLFTQEQTDKYTSAASVNRGDGNEGKASVFGKGDKQPDSVPKSTSEADSTPEETISLYHIIP